MERFLSKYTCCYLIIIIIRDDVGINRKISLERSQTGGKPGKVCDWIKVIQVWLIARLSFILCYDSRPKNRTKAKNHLLMVLLNKCQNRFYLCGSLYRLISPGVLSRRSNWGLGGIDVSLENTSRLSIPTGSDLIRSDPKMARNTKEMKITRECLSAYSRNGAACTRTTICTGIGDGRW